MEQRRADIILALETDANDSFIRGILQAQQGDNEAAIEAFSLSGGLNLYLGELGCNRKSFLQLCKENLRRIRLSEKSIEAHISQGYDMAVVGAELRGIKEAPGEEYDR